MPMQWKTGDRLEHYPNEAVKVMPIRYFDFSCIAFEELPATHSICTCECCVCCCQLHPRKETD